MINLEEHKIYVESLNMEVVPYSVAKTAVSEAADYDTGKYFKELDKAVNELQISLQNINLND